MAKPTPSPVSDETAKLIVDAATGILNWVRATPARTAGALFVAGIVGAIVLDSTQPETKK